jgi:ferredoxin/nitrate reductase gamma subunit
MSLRVDPDLLQDVARYGGVTINKCFNCGNCTAICPHSEGYDTFPRKLIRYAQVGVTDRLVGSKDLWICTYCGECSDTCPREAEPGEFMAAARRYAISRNDPTGLSRLLYTSPAASLVAFLAVTALLAFFLLRDAGPMTGRFFEFIPGKAIHDVGVVVGLVALAVILVGAIRMARGVVASPEFGNGLANPEGQGTRLARAIGAVLMEVFSQKRYRECASEKTGPWYLSRWFAHWAIFWGFMGLLFATTWDYLDTLPDGSLVPLYYPPRLVGTIAGLLFLYGTGAALWQRLTGTTKYAKDSAVSDWALIFYLFLLAATGFVLEILAYAAPATGAGNVILLVHIILAFELVLMLPFSKLAHAVYRSLAVFLHAYKGAGVPVREAVPLPWAA